MARRITAKDVDILADAIVRDSEHIRAIDIRPGSPTNGISWMFEFHMVSGETRQLSFWDLNIMTAREAHTMLYGMTYALKIGA